MNNQKNKSLGDFIESATGFIIIQAILFGICLLAAYGQGWRPGETQSACYDKASYEASAQEAEAQYDHMIERYYEY